VKLRRAALAAAFALVSWSPGRAAAPPPVYHFQVTAGPRAAELQVQATLPPGRDGQLCVQEGYGAFVSELRLGPRGKLHPARLEGDCLPPAECEKNGCELRYTFALAEAASKRRNRARAFEHEGVLLSPPGTWLLGPVSPRVGVRYRLSVKTPPEILFVNGAFPERGHANVFEGFASDLIDGPYAGFGPFQTARVETARGVVDVAITPGERALSNEVLVGWVQSAAANVAGYFGRFPVPRALVIVLIGGRRAVGYGSGMGFGGASVMISVGNAARAEDLKNDWVLTHELSHLALPNLRREHRWLEEGMATYVELVARARAGALPAEVLWRDLMNGLPNGVKAVGEGGLDVGGGWAGTYWGGALYWFLADVAIREQTGNVLGVEHALRGIMAEGTIADAWRVERVLRVGDEATGTQALRDWYARLGKGAYTVDLGALWARLGVSRSGGGVAFDDSAPLASVRRAIAGAPAPAGTARSGS
jgi:hypothetical protein